MKKRVLLTGGTGFVGRQILAALLNGDVELRVVIRTGSQERLTNKVSDIVFSDDIFTEDVAWWANTCRNVDTVIHAAWYAEPGNYLQSPKNLDCLNGTLQLAKGAAEAGVRRFVGVGTCFEYDLSVGHLSVQTPLRPVTPYAGAKAATFIALSNCLPALNLEFSWCRLFYLYGEGEDERRLVPYVRSRIVAGQPVELTSGKQIRDFADVSVAGAMIAEIALSDRQGPANICTGKPITVRELAEQIAHEYGRQDLLKFGMRADNLTDPPCVVGIVDEKTNDPE